MLAGLRTLFSTETFMARGHSYLWTPELVVLELATNAVIALAAAAIAVALGARRGARGRAVAPGSRTWLLAAFALALAARARPRRLGDLDAALRRRRRRARRGRGRRDRRRRSSFPGCCGAEADDGDRRIRPLDALALADLVRRREVTPAELLEEAIARAERVNPRVNAIVAPLYEQARRDAAALPRVRRAPFRGVPLLLKDLDAAVAGVPLTAGSRFLADFRPARDATIVERFQARGRGHLRQDQPARARHHAVHRAEAVRAGAQPLESRQLTPGGSSGGAAAAVAAGIVPSRTRTTAAARSASRPRAAACSG